MSSRNVEWPKVERFCFNDTTNPDDEELGVQIVKDLHRTGCSLFCGSSGLENQALLKRVLLGFARWNKAVGYCQGFNMLAALILQVMEKNESDALKVGSSHCVDEILVTRSWFIFFRLGNDILDRRRTSRRLLCQQSKGTVRGYGCI